MKVWMEYPIHLSFDSYFDRVFSRLWSFKHKDTDCRLLYKSTTYFTEEVNTNVQNLKKLIIF